MKKILSNMLIAILLFALTITIFALFTLYKNYNLIRTIIQANESYIYSQNDYHFSIEIITPDISNANTNNLNINDLPQNTSIRNFYKKGNVIKTIEDENEESEFICYENSLTNEYFSFYAKDSTVTPYITSIKDRFINSYIIYSNLDKVKITYDDSNYIVTIANQKNYFSKEDYRIKKIELYNDTGIVMEEIYTYYDEEIITDEMIARPEI